MTGLYSNPLNRNMLSPIGFKFSILKCPNINFFVQKINLPEIFIDPADMPNPLTKIPYSGEHIQWGTLAITFKLDEDLNGWKEIHNWLKGLGFPNEFGEYAALSDQDRMGGGGIKSDLQLFILSSNKVPRWVVNYYDAFPISLSSLEFDSTTQDVNYLEATAVFQYTSYEIQAA